MKNNESSIPRFFDRYIDLVNEQNINLALQKSLLELENINKTQLNKIGLKSYDPKKWCLNDVFQHIIDAERIFTYRALVFSRNDNSLLPSFSHDNYAIEAKSKNRQFLEIIYELTQVRKSTICLFNSFNDEVLERKGLMSNCIFIS